MPVVDWRLPIGGLTIGRLTIDGLTMNPEDFYNLAKHPTPELLKAYDWLDLPAGASLEGYLWPATYEASGEARKRTVERMRCPRIVP